MVENVPLTTSSLKKKKTLNEIALSRKIGSLLHLRAEHSPSSLFDVLKLFKKETRLKKKKQITG